MNNHQQFLSSLAAQQNANAQAGLGDDVSINKHQFGANVDLSETYKLIVRKGKKVVESMKVNPKEIEDAIKFAKAQHKGLNVTVEKNGKVVREEWEEYSEPISISEMNYIGSDKKFGRKFYEKDGQLHVKSKTGTQTQNLGSVDVKSNAKMIKGLKKEESEVEEAIKYDSAGDSTGTVTGKGKRDRGPGGKVTVKYKGSDTYKDGAKLPIKARDMGRLIKTARKKGTTPYDSRNLKNPRLTKDHVEHDVAEGMSDTAKKAAKMLRKMRQDTPRDVHNPGRPLKKSAGDIEADRREKERLSRREAIEDMTEASKHHTYHVSNIDYETDGDHKAKKRLPKSMKVKVPHHVHKGGEDDVKDHIDDHISNETGYLHNGYDSKKVKESFEKLTPAQERDADRRLKPTRATVSKVRLRAGEKDVEKSVKAYQADKAGKPGNTKIRRMRDLKLKLEDTDSIKEGPAHQNPLKTAYGGMKAAQNTPSMKAYYAKVKKDQAARAKQIEQERKDGIRSKYESVEQVDEKEGTYAYKKRNKRNPARDMRKEPDGSPTDGYYAKGDGSHAPRKPSKYSALGRRRRVEDVELEEGRQPFAVVDTANNNEVVATASNEAGAKSIIRSADLPPMSIKDKSKLKIVKTRKKQHIGHPLAEAQVDELKMPKNPNNPKIKAAKRKGAERAFSKFAKHSSDSLRAVDKGDSKKADSSFNKGERAFKRYNDREKGSY